MTAFSITLEARNPERGHFRHYHCHLEAGRDLFGTWLVEATFGRIGTTGRTMRARTNETPLLVRISRHTKNKSARSPRESAKKYPAPYSCCR